MWKPTNNRFVAFIDLMGFKEFVLRNDHDFVYDKLKELANTFKEVESDEISKEYVHITTFSDSIFLFSKDDSLKSFEEFCLASLWICGKAMEINLPFKGAISFGLTTVNKSTRIYVGQAIIDAYLLQEQIHYYGVLTHYSFDKFITEREWNKSEFFDDKFFYAKAPTKGGWISHYNLDWVQPTLIDVKMHRFFNDVIEDLKLLVSGTPRMYIDNTIQIFTTRHGNLLE